jgi:hypothetical protein
MFDKWCSKSRFALATKLYEGRRREERELRDCQLAELPIVQYTLMAVFPVARGKEPRPGWLLPFFLPQPFTFLFTSE